MKQEKLKDPRKRKMILVLPLLIIPFLTMGFWALGGGTGDLGHEQKSAAGLNLDLPNAQLKDDKGENKLSYYEEAEKDSLKWKEGMENDPFFSSRLHDSITNNQFRYHPSPLQTEDYIDPNEQKVYQKLQELNLHPEHPDNYSAYNEKQKPLASFEKSSFEKEDVNRLEDMMKRSNTPNEKDPEVEQLNSMMDRILDIQHPERVKDKLNAQSPVDKKKVYPVRSSFNSCSISLLDTSKKEEAQNQFYGLEATGDAPKQNAIEAAIHETQSLVDGSNVKMRLLDDVIIDGTTVPRGNFVFGKVFLQGERLQIDINSIRKGKELFPVQLTVYDLDGMEGIHIPGAFTRDAFKQSADNSLQSIGMNSIDPSFKVQAATAGISAAKSLLTKKVKLLKVTVKAGYKILLKEKINQ